MSTTVLTLTWVLSLIVLALPVRAADHSVASPDKPVEYMIYQYPGVVMLIQIDAIETEFEARIYGPDRALIKSSRLPSRRIGPVFQLIEPSDTARQLIVEIIPAYATDRSRIKMELLQLREQERTDAIQAEAFRLMSRAVDATPNNDSTTWASKTYTFKRAAQVFESLGWEELRLWCEFYAAHLVYFKLNDVQSALEMARAVQAAAGRAGFEEIQMAAMQLAGIAMTSSIGTDSSIGQGEQFESIHRILNQTAELADRLGFQSERGLALFNDGIAWEKQEKMEQALQQYRRALDITVAAGDTELANRIRNQAAFAYESEGSVAGAIEMLDQVGEELEEEDAALELAESLFEKGRILNESFRFYEAADALKQSHELLVTAGYGSRVAQTGLALGQAYFGLGQMDMAANILSESIASAPVAELASELQEALGILAEVQRYRGDWQAMDEARQQQESFLRNDAEHARYLYERAMDEMSRPEGKPSSVDALLSRSQERASAVGDATMVNRAQLQRCANQSNSQCAASEVNRAFKHIQEMTSPRQFAEARFALARILRKGGNPGRSFNEMSHLIDEIRYYRMVLPGVLGGWYWGNRRLIFNEYLETALEQSAVNTTSFSDGRAVLLVLERVKRIANADSKNPFRAENPAFENQADEIRTMLGGFTRATQPSEMARSGGRLMEAVQISFQDFMLQVPTLDENLLDNALSRLPVDSVFLSYGFSGDDVFVMVGNTSGVRIRKLAGSEEISARLVGLARVLGNPETGDLFSNDLLSGLESLGQLMVKPVQSFLQKKIFLMPLGALRGFPFDLIRLDGRYIAEQHQVINLMSLSRTESFTAMANTSDIDLFFLAGDPELQRDVFSYEQKRSAEISAVTDLFVGPALHIVQGPALKRDEFDDERFTAADFIHLSIPGLINLENGQSDVMTLSRSGDFGDTTLVPNDLPEALNATLAVLSLTRFEGHGATGFSNYHGFVSDLLDSGVNSVIASLWPLDDASRTRFISLFYQALATEHDVAVVLYQTKRSFLEQQQSPNPAIWAGFQLYLQ